MALSSSITSTMSSDIKTQVQMKPANSIMSQKSCYPPEQSLVAALSPHRTSIKALQMQFSMQLKQQRSMSLPLSLYDDRTQGSMEPPPKRRRFQRRNSKTAAMLFSSISSIVASDFEENPEKEDTSIKEESSESTEDPWEGGLEIAEELVRQLKLRRKSASV